ncbi:hypothetical protein [Halobacterium jilantaiense]|uniref:Uncharacterized protein n=1 Tax=Halobacterium jilantaiense TaxID=355548 RepID=A0A1I0QCJ2_9EURY|nr:hypothetical protein [Halobacterium jilantaiense]SEW24706.1 hypothetical protein SAMN04487945_2480 [Halobacterium jilantaiense]
MYDDSFDTDWDPEDVGREEAVWRAYALGAAAALGETHPGEYRKLVTATGRSLVEMAYDEGKSEAANLDSELASGSDEAELDFPDRETAVWSKLITYREEEGDEIDADRGGGRERDDLPDLLRRIDLDSLNRDDLDRLRLPELLSKK